MSKNKFEENSISIVTSVFTHSISIETNAGYSYLWSFNPAPALKGVVIKQLKSVVLKSKLYLYEHDVIFVLIH